MMKRITALLLCALLLLSLCACAKDQTTVETNLYPDDDSMNRFGNLFFEISADELLTKFELGDIVTVTIDGYEPIDLPVCASYDDVPPGGAVLRAKSGKEHIALAINYGQFGILLGLLEENADGGDYLYKLRDDVKLPLTAKITLKEKGGYLSGLRLSALVRADDRSEYAVAPDDVQFANFRVIETTGMGKNVLFRSSSPIDDWGARNTTADALAEKAGIRTFINLADSEATASAFPGFADSYYAGQDVLYCNLPAAFRTEAFSTGFADALRYIATHEGPFLIHCAEGKDRAGFAAAVLELLMGAGYDELQEDFLRTYENYYAPLKDGGEQLDDALRAEIRAQIGKNLAYAYGLESLDGADPVAATEEYLHSIGLTEAELDALRTRLAGN